MINYRYDGQNIFRTITYARGLEKSEPLTSRQFVDEIIKLFPDEQDLMKTSSFINSSEVVETLYLIGPSGIDQARFLFMYHDVIAPFKTNDDEVKFVYYPMVIASAYFSFSEKNITIHAGIPIYETIQAIYDFKRKRFTITDSAKIYSLVKHMGLLSNTYSSGRICIRKNALDLFENDKLVDVYDKVYQLLFSDDENNDLGYFTELEPLLLSNTYEEAVDKMFVDSQEELLKQIQDVYRENNLERDFSLIG